MVETTNNDDTFSNFDTIMKPDWNYSNFRLSQQQQQQRQHNNHPVMEKNIKVVIRECRRIQIPIHNKKSKKDPHFQSLIGKL